MTGTRTTRTTTMADTITTATDTTTTTTTRTCSTDSPYSLFTGSIRYRRGTDSVWFGEWQLVCDLVG